MITYGREEQKEQLIVLRSGSFVFFGSLAAFAKSFFFSFYPSLFPLRSGDDVYYHIAIVFST